MREIAAGKEDSLDPVWKALSDPTRRAILDFLRDRPRTTTEIVERFPQLSRFGAASSSTGRHARRREAAGEFVECRSDPADL